MMALIPAILDAIVAIPKIGAMFDSYVSQIVLWYLQRQRADTLSQISDAAAFAARAVTDEDRYNAAKKWHDALSLPRVSTS